MSRKTDTSKIERIRQSAVSIISREGINGCSVAAIAKQAGVSVGYLYRHYPSKEALINSMLDQYYLSLNEQITQQIASGLGFWSIARQIVRYLTGIAREDEVRMKCIITLVNDFSVPRAAELGAKINALTGRLLELARREPDVREELAEEDIYMSLIGIPMQYLSIRYGGLFDAERCGDEAIVRMAVNALKK